jgi:hypothetical protein
VRAAVAEQAKTRTVRHGAIQVTKQSTVGRQSTVKASATRKTNAPARKRSSQPTLADRAYAALSRAGRAMTGTALAKRLRVSTTAIGPTLSALNRTHRASKQADGSWLAL